MKRDYYRIKPMKTHQVSDDHGSAVILPDREVRVCEPNSFTIIYTVGKNQIEPTGGIYVVIPYGFTPPQISYPTGIGYTVATCSRTETDIVLSLTDPAGVDRHEDTFGLKIYATVDRGILETGDSITLYYGCGDKSGLFGEGASPQYFDGFAEFGIGVDPDGSRSFQRGGFVRLRSSPTILVRSREPEKLQVVAPSSCQPDAALWVRVTARDRYGNLCEDFEGDVNLTALQNGTTLNATLNAALGTTLDTVCRITRGRGEISSSDIIEMSPDSGTSTIAAVHSPTGIRGESNPIGMTLAGEQIYWGDIHVMTGISAGLQRPSDALSYARDTSFLDFCAITDGDRADAYFSDEEWVETCDAVRRFYDPGRFVTLLASEYHERKAAGDKNIYYRNDTASLLRWSDLEGDQPEALWNALENTGEPALTIPHHTVSGSAVFDPWDHHHPMFQRLVEIYSIWGNAECEGCSKPNYWNNNYDNSVREALNRGMRLGIVASGDSHDGRPGNSSWMRLRRGYPGGLVAVFASELTREAIFDALWNRRCYGTTGARIILEVAINGSPMGAECEGKEDRKRRRIHIRGIGTDQIASVALVRNGKVIYDEEPGTSSVEIEYIDRDDFSRIALQPAPPVTLTKPFVYYYVRLLQKDGEMAWSSPIWFS